MEISRRRALYEFLEHTCLVHKGSEFTHTNIYGPTASYYVKPEHTEKFWELYKAAADTDDELCLTERHRDIGPVVIDLDFRFDADADDKQNALTRRYTEKHVHDIVMTYCKGLAKYVCNESSFDVYVLEKSTPVLHKGLVKDGMHIMIPGIVTKPVFQFLLREQLLQQLATVMADMGLKNSITDVVDEAVIERNNWQMYGSKKPHCDRYEVTRIYKFDTTTQEIESQNVSTKCSDYVELLSIRNKYMETEIKFETEDELAKFEELVNKRKMRNHFKNAVIGNTKNVRMNESDEFDLARKLVELLNDVRAESYNEWVSLGWCLRNIDHRLLDTWTEFSRRSPKFVEGETAKLWYYMNYEPNGLRMGTLRMWAKQDSPDQYNEIVQNELCTLIRAVASNQSAEYDVALVIKKMYNNEFIYDSRNKIWYAFYDHRWHLIDDGIGLKRKFPVEVLDIFRKYSAQFQSQAALSTQQEEKDVYDGYVSRLVGVIKNLKKTSFQNNVMAQCAMLFNLERIDEKFDTNVNLIGFENGVYDLDAMEFREGYPEDYICISTGINYIEYNAASIQNKEIHKFLAQVLRSDVVREYVLSLFASFLHGNVREERFHVWTGVGSNGKSRLLDLYQKAFGEYCCTLPIALLTQKRSSSNSASPELARAKSKRFACLQEPGENERLNIGLMKEMTGGDKLYARGLYREGTEFKPQFKMILTCNHLPAVPSDDGGTWRRIRVVRFESRFCDNPDPAKPNEFPIDTELSSRFDDWKEPFMSMLIEHYKKTVTSRIKEPEEVMECTREYQRRNDIIADFLDGAVEKNDAGFLSIADAFVEFKAWLREEGVQDRSMRKSDFQNYIEKQYGKSVKKKLVKGWVGYRLKSSVIDNIQDDYD